VFDAPLALPEGRRSQPLHGLRRTANSDQQSKRWKAALVKARSKPSHDLTTYGPGSQILPASSPRVSRLVPGLDACVMSPASRLDGSGDGAAPQKGSGTQSGSGTYLSVTMPAEWYRDQGSDS